MLKIKLGNTLSKSDFERIDSDLRTRLLTFQNTLAENKTPLLIVLCGLDGSGRGKLLSEMSGRMNPRQFRIHSFWDEGACFKNLPFFARYWDALPPAGMTSIHVGAWYDDLFERKLRGDDIENDLTNVCDFEQTLADNGMRIIKIFTHLSKNDQKERLIAKEELIQTEKSILKKKLARSKSYKKNVAAVTNVLDATHRNHAPWHVVDATDLDWMLTEVTQIILDSPNINTDKPSYINGSSQGESDLKVPSLSHIEVYPDLDKDDYKDNRNALQDKLFALSWKAYQQKKSPILVFEGWDAAGKGGTIRRITESLDARLWSVHGSSAPNEVERQYHYLWRYWKTLPHAGKMAIYDRSWYGRVLVERVESYATDNEWKRSYAEINSFEHQLAESGSCILKFWLHITPEEQKRRFEAREEIEYKQYKITDEDWRNRAKWDAYTAAANDMFAKTHTEAAPWIVIPSVDKYHARVAVLEHVVNALENHLK